MSFIYTVGVFICILVSKYGASGLIDQLKYAFNGDSTTYFYVYTPESPEEPIIVVNVENASVIQLLSDFKPSLPMRIIVHGWWKTPRNDFARQAFLHCGNFNVVNMDWTHGSDTIFLPLAQLNTRIAGNALATFLKTLQSTVSLNMRQVEITGEGLGAAVAGEAGSRLGNLSTIVACDPSISILSRELSYADAEYVQAIHSSSFLGTLKSLGDADFFLNGGREQPQCTAFGIVCNHETAANAFLDSLFFAPLTGCRRGFEGDCGYQMGGEPVKIYKGVFDVTTEY